MWADDPDTADEHIFSILSADPPEGAALFGIGGCSGRLFVAAEGLDALAQPEYRLRIGVRDDVAVSPLSDSGNLTVLVLNANDPPYFLVASDEVRRDPFK